MKGAFKGLFKKPIADTDVNVSVSETINTGFTSDVWLQILFKLDDYDLFKTMRVSKEFSNLIRNAFGFWKERCFHKLWDLNLIESEKETVSI